MLSFTQTSLLREQQPFASSRPNSCLGIPKSLNHTASHCGFALQGFKTPRRASKQNAPNPKVPFSYFGLINTPVFLSAFSSLLSLTFSPPSLSNLYLGHQLKLRSHQHPSLQQRAIADFCGLLDDRIRGSKPHSELCPFLGVSAAKVDGKHSCLPELLIFLPLRPLSGAPFASLPKGPKSISRRQLTSLSVQIQIQM